MMRLTRQTLIVAPARALSRRRWGAHWDSTQIWRSLSSTSTPPTRAPVPPSNPKNRPNHHLSPSLHEAFRSKSSVALDDDMAVEDHGAVGNKSAEYLHLQAEIRRLNHIRIVGIFAHVDAGKTTCTERMLALAGIIRRAGSVDDGDTVTDYLPAERERGITIQSAAVSFPWGWHNNNMRGGDDLKANDNVTISLLDTPGHIDFSVEVNRSVAVLDGAVLVVDAVAGVQAQTETVWRAMKKPSLNNHALVTQQQQQQQPQPQPQDHAHEPLPCIALINKMDKEGCNFRNAVQSLRDKLPGAHPIPIQIPLFRSSSSTTTTMLTQSKLLPQNIVAPSDETTDDGEFVGVVDLVHMRAILWPDLVASNGFVSNVEDCVPQVISLLKPNSHEPYDNATCQVTMQALKARRELFEALANVDEAIEEYYLSDAQQEPSNAELRASLRKAVLSHRLLPVLAAAALRGKGVEPILDAIADLLPSPLDRLAPALTLLNNNKKEPSSSSPLCNDGNISTATTTTNLPTQRFPNEMITLGHSLHPALLALAFKVVHMKGRGGSGDGRVVFARVYSGELRDRDTVQVTSPAAPGELPAKPRSERIGGMLELAGGRFNKLQDGVCKSGGVCALVGLKSVVTGDTLVIPSDHQDKKSRRKNNNKLETVCLAGVSSPKPVLTVRLEAETTDQQARLSEALYLLSIEDPSLVVEETESATLLSGLGELHIEVTLDRLHREFGLQVRVGPPAVTYRETITEAIETDGKITYDRIAGGTRLQGSVHLLLEPTWHDEFCDSPGMLLTDPVVTIGPLAREFLGVKPEVREEDLMLTSSVAKSLIQGCQGALKRGPVGPYALANITCHVVDVDAEDGLAGLQALPGAIRAAAANAITTLLSSKRDTCQVLEPVMSVEVSVPNDLVGAVLSDLTGRRGAVDEVVIGEGSSSVKSLIRGDVPLVEILGYANGLRSLTGGEGSFTAEYKGHAPSTSR